MIVDRANRDLLVETIDQYLHDELTAFQFDDAIFAIRGNTQDDTVQRVVDFLWLFYDDCDDHQVILDRIGWNCFQRLRLLLKSDAHLDCSTLRIWSFSQVFAATSLTVFLALAYRTGWGAHLLLAAVPFGFVSIGISFWRRRLHRLRADHWDASLYPFTSVAQVLWVGHSVPGFRKERFPSHMAERRIRRDFSLPSWVRYPFWLLYSPIVLLAQVLPITASSRRVVT